jgi:hypothetical protein
MAYSQELFQEWIFEITFKMDYFTTVFANKNNLTLDYSIKSLDDLEVWIFNNYNNYKMLLDKEEGGLIDYLLIYIGETFRKHIGGKWHIDLENKKNAYYSMPVLVSDKFKGEKYIAPMTFATACISRKRGNYISTILKNRMEDMGLAIDK